MPQAVVTPRLGAPGRTPQRTLAVLTVMAQCGIAVIGSVVRVSESGLGCPTWPRCAPGSLVPVADPLLGHLHQWIEFGNRLLGVVVVALSILVFGAALLARPWRRRYVLLALTMPLGVVLQAVIGGLTVLLALRWWSVSVHFLVSPLLIWLSVLLLRAVDEGDEPARPLVSPALRRLLVVQSAVIAAVLVAGTFVVAAGPHAGDARTPRLQHPIPELAAAHAALVGLLIVLLVVFGLRAGGSFSTAPALRLRYRVLVGLVVANGVLGIVQYLLRVPDVMVPFHVLGAVLVTAVGAALWCAARDRGPAPPPSMAAQPGAAAQNGTGGICG